MSVSCPICDGLRVAREHAKHAGAEPEDTRWSSMLERQLARGQAEIVRLRSALEHIAEGDLTTRNPRTIARAALAAEGGPA